ASHIAHSNPRIKRIFDQWRSRSSEALLSVLEKNKELKMTLLQESPWLAEAKDETEQKYRIALLFDMNRIAQMKSETWAKLQEMQYPDGSWPWFEGMRPSLFTTLSVVESYARLYALGVEQDVPHEMVKAASFLDEKAQEAYRTMMDEEGFDPADKHLPPFVVSWLYARSLLGDHLNSVAEQEWYRFYSDQLKEHWLSLGLYQQSLAAIILYYNVEPDLAEEIIASLKERAILSDQRGMYWRELNASPYWYRAPIATMASLIEAFTLISGGEESVSLMKKWLLSQKQTNRWNSDIGTIHAIYALLLEGDEMLSGSNEVEITLGDELVVDGTDPKEPGTGYVKKVWHGEEVQSSMGEMQVNSSSDRFSWGALHWQYYAPYDEIEAAGNGLTISRKRYQKINTSKGPKYVEIKEEDRVKKGDRVVVRMQVTADRDYSFVHLKDQRSAAYEPVENRSGYRYQNGRGYYLSIRDASMNYYFDFLPKGTYLFEYELFKVRDGVYTGGLSTIQCVYAPEFNAHSAGF
ncbi:MAG: alpha-2-macroglobulin, partial [Bacteroidetes bacterium]